ncbi:hypothetical protein [Undibacterium griseum]|uniref:Uncharacterized protein n=1 Tax=Undibacterium griseum TaxID=2762295 RepID=A0ABR6YK20_9BURK|nr:hypothetical protein [Undibacterium griseum]MBC3884250.1 hypothetical protein [Undibacterium griseum]
MPPVITSNPSALSAVQGAPDFLASAIISADQPVSMGAYYFQVVPIRAMKSLLLQVHYQEQAIIAAHLPAMFLRGAMLAASAVIGGHDCLLLTANAAPGSGAAAKSWFGIFRHDGKRLSASSLDQQIVRARAHEDGIALFFANGDSMRIKL